MNTLFNPARFAKLFIYEQKSSNFLRNIFIFVILYVTAVTLLNIFVVNIITPFSTKIAIILGYFSVAFYYPLLKREKRDLYKMLPASSLEKYLSMAINTLIVVPATYVILSTAISLTLAAVRFQGEIPGMQFQLPSLLSLCIQAEIISIVTFLYFSSMSRNSILQGLIIISLYFFSGPLRREFQEAEHICFILLATVILQFFIYLKIKSIE